MQIDYSTAKGVQVFTGNDGKGYAAKKVVITVPLGVLKVRSY